MGIITNKIREPNVSGSFYEADPFVLQRDIAQFFEESRDYTIQKKKTRVKALIAPHAGYVYCGRVMASVYQTLENGKYDRVVLIGPSHSVSFGSVAFDKALSWKTPLGTVSVDRKTNEQFLFHEEFDILPSVFDKEHSLEVQLPFLQTVLPAWTLLPLCTGQDLPHKKIAEILTPMLTATTIIVVSSDFSHYHTQKDAEILDQNSINAILSRNTSSVGNQVDACGFEGIAILTEMALQNNWKPKLVTYTTSAHVTRDSDAVVGYAGIIYA